MQKGLVTIFFLLVCFASQAQKNLLKKNTDPRDYQYHNEASGGVRLQSNGFSLFAEYGWIRDLKRTRLMQLEYTYFINYRQKKQNARIENGRDYAFGVQNRFHAIRFSYGIKRTIADKANRNGVRLSFVLFGGISLGLVKPYYLMITTRNDGNVQINEPIRYNGQNDSLFLDREKIAEAAPIRYGLSKIEPVPGIHGKFALDFDWGTKDEFVKALEAGIMLDLYYKRIPIMVNNSNRIYQLGLYLSFQFGKRW
jgi:hypothetical protein